MPLTTHLCLSAGLVCELGGRHSMLRATTRRSGSAVIIYAGGAIDASNVATWGRLLSEAAAVTAPPGPFVVDVNGLDFMGCCAFEALAAEAATCRDRQVDLRVVSRDPLVDRILGLCGLRATLSAGIESR